MVENAASKKLLKLAAEQHRSGQVADAEAGYRRVLSQYPDSADANHLLGVLLHEQGDHQQGEKLITRAIDLRPRVATYHANLGLVYDQLRQTSSAIRSYARAFELNPELVALVLHLAKLLTNEGRAAEAYGVLERALTRAPNNWQLLLALGLNANICGRRARALEYLQHALNAGAQPATILANKGMVYQGIGMLSAAIECYEQALAADAGHVRARWNLGVADLAACAWRHRDMLDDVSRRPGAYAGIATPFELTTMTSDASLLHVSAKAWTQDQAPGHPQPLCPTGARRERAGDRIRLGYLSDELREHPIGWLTGSVFERHDRSRFTVGAYYFGPPENSELHRRIRQSFDRWVDIRDMSPRAAAERIHRDGIDILIDLKGHVANARPEIAASRPAPIQVNWLGFTGTMGADYMDYIVVDELVVPKGHERHFSERLVRLPQSYMVNDPQRMVAPDSPPREGHGLREADFVFCCFNQVHKITPSVFACWMGLLGAVPSSVLWLLGGAAEAQTNLMRTAKEAGVDPRRLVFAPHLPQAAHLARHRHADLFLDTLPYGAHATASDALWAGLPVLTCLGESFAGRVASSLLRAVGLPELVTESLDEYERLALALANDRNRLDSLKRRLEHNRATEPLFNCNQFAEHLDRAFETMWEIYQAGEQPRSFDVPRQTL